MMSCPERSVKCKNCEKEKMPFSKAVKHKCYLMEVNKAVAEKLVSQNYTLNKHKEIFKMESASQLVCNLGVNFEGENFKMDVNSLESIREKLIE